MKKQSMALGIIFFAIFPMTLVQDAAAAAWMPRGKKEAPKTSSSGPDSANMQAAYDEVLSLKMNKYDQLSREITQIGDRLKDLLDQEQKLVSQKVQAEEAYANHSKEAAAATIKKGSDEAEDEETLKLFAETISAESRERKKNIEQSRSSLQAMNRNMEDCQTRKQEIDSELAALDKEYRDMSSQWLVLKGKNGADPKPGGEAAGLSQALNELEAKVRQREKSRQQLLEEALKIAEKMKAMEEKISALEKEEFSRAEELKGKIESFGKKEDRDPAEDLEAKQARKKAEEANAKAGEAQAALKTVEGELSKVLKEKAVVENELTEKTDALKVRIAALVAQKEDQDALGVKQPEDAKRKLKKDLKHAQEEIQELRRRSEEAAIVDKEAKLKYDREMVEKHFNLGVVYERNGFYKDAEREYLEGLVLDPRDSGIHYNLAILYDDRLDESDKALEHYYKYLELRPIGESGELVKDWITRAELEKRLGKKVR